MPLGRLALVRPFRAETPQKPVSAAGGRHSVPHILRRMAITPKRKRQVRHLDKKRCLYCRSSSKLQVDHILPKAAGGKGGWDNLQTLCRPCNQRKADRRIDYRDDERRREAKKKGGYGRQPPTDLENLAAATGALHIARQRWYEALSVALTAEHPQQNVAAAAGMSPMIPHEVDGQP